MKEKKDFFNDKIKKEYFLYILIYDFHCIAYICRRRNVFGKIEHHHFDLKPFQEG